MGLSGALLYTLTLCVRWAVGGVRWAVWDTFADFVYIIVLCVLEKEAQKKRKEKREFLSF